MVSARPEEAATIAARRAVGPIRHGPRDENTVTGRPSARCRPRVWLVVTSKPLQFAYEVSCRVRVGAHPARRASSFTPRTWTHVRAHIWVPRPCHGRLRTTARWQGSAVRAWASRRRGTRSRSDATHATG